MAKKLNKISFLVLGCPYFLICREYWEFVSSIREWLKFLKLCPTSHKEEFALGEMPGGRQGLISRNEVLAYRAMVIKEKTVNDLPVVSLMGRLDLFSKNAFQELIEKHRSIGTKGLIVDLKGVSFIDSVGLGLLTVAAKTFQGVKGKLIIVNPQDTVKKILDQMNFSKILPLFSTDDEFSQFSQLS